MISLSSVLPVAFNDRLRPYWRRRRIVLGTAWAVFVLGWLGVAALPDRFEAMTSIYVETDTMLAPLLRDIAIQADLQKQLDVMHSTLLSRKNLSRVIHATGLDHGAHGEAELEALYRDLEKNIVVKTDGHNVFTVTYRNADPALAKRVVAALLTILVETNIGQSRSDMANARTFIEAQIAEYERKLKDAEGRQAAYKAQHMDVLEAGGTAFGARLDGARGELAAAKLKLDDSVLLRDQASRQLASVPQYLDVDAPTQIVIAGAGAAAGPAARVQQLEQQLQQLRARYTERYPDVITTERELAAARAEAAAVAGGSGATPDAPRSRLPNVVYEQLRLRLAQAEADVATARSHYQAAEENVRRLAQLAEIAPNVEAGMADINREYGVLKAKYDELLGRRESARISEAVESSGDKVQFRVIDAPQVATLPAWPNRPLFLTGVLVLAVGAGVALAFALHQIDDTIGSAETLATLFDLPVIGCVPRVDNAVRGAERRRSLRYFGLAAGSLMAAYLVAVLLARPAHALVHALISPLS